MTPKTSSQTGRKHWFEYPTSDTCYGSWLIKYKRTPYYGFGVYLLDGTDAWLDPECATPSEKKQYRQYLRARWPGQKVQP